MPLPGLAEWGRGHPQAQKISAANVNKVFRGVQTIARWAYRNEEEGYEIEYDENGWPKFHGVQVGYTNCTPFGANRLR